MTGPTSRLGASLLVGLSNQDTRTDIIAFASPESKSDAFQRVKAQCTNLDKLEVNSDLWRVEAEHRYRLR